MTKVFILVLSICLTANFILADDSEEEDYSKFNNAALLNKLREYNLKRDGVIAPNNIIDPPNRCRQCFKPDAKGRCRKIVGCEI